MNNIKCPTCGHRHPSGMGLAFCACEDCATLFFHRPDLMAPEYAKRREELLQEQTHADED